jgi:putative transposase
MDLQGYDAGKKVTGRKRHILVDTLGLLLSVAVHPADIQDRDGVAYVLNASTRALFPFLERIFADGGYQGPRAAAAVAATGEWILEIVKRNELHKFVVLPLAWRPSIRPFSAATLLARPCRGAALGDRRESGEAV